MKKIEQFLRINQNIIYSFCTILFIFFLWSFFSIRWDDSYISYRYALNYSQNGYWNWNSDNNNVEAYTNYSYTLLTLIPIYLKIDPTIFFTFLNIFWILAIVYQMHIGLSSKILFFCSLILIILNPFVSYHISTGMETIFFIFLLFESFRYLVTYQNNSKNENIFYFLLLLLPLTRPEGAIYSLVCFLINTFVNKKRVQKKITFGLVIIIGIIYMGWRYIHFERLLPNTFYLKSIKGFSLNNWLNFLENSRLYLIFMVALNIFVKNKVIFLLSCITIVVAFFLYAPSDLVTTINDRFQLQVFLPVFLVALFLIDTERKNSLIFVSVLWFYFASYTSLENIKSVKPFSPSMYFYKKIGQSLSKYSEKKYSLLIGEAGIIPYFSKWNCYDYIGLADKELSRNKLSFQYLEKRNPDLIFLYSSTNEVNGISFNSHQQSTIYDYMKSKRNYNQIGSLNNGGWYLLIFLKSNIPDYCNIKTEINEICVQSQIMMLRQYSKENLKNWYLLKYIQ
jgi:arabinofuranosyltransferase